LIEEAKWAGADAVKFQLWEPRDIWNGEGDHPFWAEERFGKIPVASLVKEAHSYALDFICTPFSDAAVTELWEHVDAWKISSCETLCHYTNRILTDDRASILSLGRTDTLSNWEMRADALLHCITDYPATPESCHLSRIPQLYKEHNCVGWSSHTGPAILCDELAVAAGAKIVEKHLKLDMHEQPETPDSGRHSVPPGLFKLMVQRIRKVEEIMGKGEFKPQPMANPRRLVGARP